jgi:serine/threonine protein kinase
MSKNHDISSIPGSSEQQYDEAAVLTSGIENALNGYAKDGETWLHAKQIFEDSIARGDRADDALNLALETAQVDAETTPQEAAKKFWSTLPTRTAIENALDGYASDSETWKLGRWTFEDMINQGRSVDEALEAALAVTGRNSKSTPSQASLRFWEILQPEYVKAWLDAPINQVDDGIVLGLRIHRPKDKGEGASTFIGDQGGRAVIVKHGDKASLKQEYDVLKNVDHKGIPSVTSYSEDVEVIGGLTRVAMEQLPGKSLDKTLSLTREWKNLPLRQDKAIRIGLGLASNFKALSDAGYLYRDLSPSHVIVDEKDGGRISVGLVDVESCLKKTRDGTAMVTQPRGTWETMSPEEFDAGNVMTESSNVYSAACLILQMVAGETPFHIPAGTLDDTDQEFAMSRSLHAQHPDIPVSGMLGGVLKKALDPNPKKRYDSLESFSEALRSAL